VPPGTSTSGRPGKLACSANAARQEAAAKVACLIRSDLRLGDALGSARVGVTHPSRPRPSASCKGDRDPDAYCREPANDRGEPYDFTSFIED
jgi:hypothetical protein